MVGGFEIDGNLCLNTNGVTGTSDWSTAGVQPVAHDGFGDATQFTQGASENNWPWRQGQISGVGTAGAAYDVGNVYAYTHEVNGEVFAYFGFQRPQTSSAAGGTTAYYVELNKLPNLPESPASGGPGPVPDRSYGDLRLGITQSGSGSLTLTGAWIWNPDNPSAVSGGWVPISTAGYAGRVNPAGVTDLSGQPLLANTFAEVGVNLSAMFGAGHQCSGNYGTFNLRSAASVSETSALKDWIRPVSLTVPPTCASVLVNKFWNINGTTYKHGAQPPGFDGTLTLDDQTGNRTGLPFDQEIDKRADGTDFHQGDDITIGENVTVPDGCANTPGGDIGPHTLASTGVNEFDVTNTVTCPHLQLQKRWVNGETGDTAHLSVTGGVTSPATNTSTVTSATGHTFTDTAHQAHTAVLPGQHITVSETLGASNTGGYDSSLACQTGNGTSVPVSTSNDGRTGTLTVPSDASPTTTITCTVVNTRTSGRLELNKVWVHGEAGDTAHLAVTGGDPSPATATSTADGTPGTQTDLGNIAGATVRSGEHITASETLGSGNTGSYESQMVCNSTTAGQLGTGTTSVSFTVPASPGAITCTVVNTRTEGGLELNKVWVHGEAGDTAHLAVTGGDPSPATATSTADGTPGTQEDLENIAGATVRSGEHITVGETLGSGNTGSYDSRLVCNSTTAGTLVNTTELSASFTVPTDPGAITCTVVNTRTEGGLELNKVWVHGEAGDTAHLAVNGGDPPTATATSTADGTPGTQTDLENIAGATVRSGEHITASEVLGSGNTGSYESQMVCNSTTAGQLGTGTTSVSFTVPTDPGAITCTVVNTRTEGGLELNKVWVHGEAGDTAHLAVTGGDPSPAEATSTADGTPGTQEDLENIAGATVHSGQHITVGETLGSGNTGSYDSRLVCNSTTKGELGTGTTSVSFTVPASPGAITCTVVNTRAQGGLELNKVWVHGEAGDTAHLAVTGGDPSPATATSTATGAADTQEDLENIAGATVHSGQHITASETLGSGNTGSYDSRLVCNSTTKGELATGTTSVSFTVPADPGAITCTVVNTRKHVPVIPTPPAPVRPTLPSVPVTG